MSWATRGRKKSLLVRAAALQHTNLTEFVIRTAVANAKEVIELSERQELSERDSLQVMDLLEKGHFNQSEPGVFDPLVASITSRDEPWMTAADFSSYVDAQANVANAYRDRHRWVRMSIANTAASGRFSSDRTVADYNTSGSSRQSRCQVLSERIAASRRTSGASRPRDLGRD